MPKRKTQEEFEQEIHALFPNIEILGNYVNINTPVSFHCNLCDYRWNQPPMSLYKGRGCPKCSGVQNEMKTREQFISDITQLNPDIIVTGDYIGNKKPIAVCCKKCGYKWNPKPNNLLSGHGCPKCAKLRVAKQKIRETEKTFVKKLEAVNPIVTISSDYIGCNKPITAHCILCNNEWLSTPEKLLGGQSCPACYEKDLSRKVAALEQNVLAKSKEEKEKATILLIKLEEKKQKKEKAVEAKKQAQERKVAEKKQKARNTIEKKKQNSLEKVLPLLASEWNYERNNPLTPKDVYYSSGKKVWWRCRFGHEYECRISDRVNHGTGCKKCAKRYRISLREHTFLYYIKHYFPDSIPSYQSEWLNRKELDIYLPSLMVGIEYDGQYYHEDDRDIIKDKLCTENGIILIRIREPGCSPYKRTDPVVQLDGFDRKSIENGIIKTLSLISSMQEYDVNTKRDKNAILASYYDAAIPGSVAEMYPELAKEWDYDLNGDLKPENIPATRSSEKYYWKCSICGYSWLTNLADRLTGSSCPACAPTHKALYPGYNDFATTDKEIAAEWHPNKNLPLTPQDVFRSSSKQIWWKCSNCGHEWKCSIECRAIKHTGCRRCAQKKRAEEEAKKIYKYGLDGSFIQEYKNTDIAAKANHISRTALANACQGKVQSSAGYQWRYEKQDSITPYTRPYTIKKTRVVPRHRDTKKVYKYSLDGQYLQEYLGVWEAAQEAQVDESAIRSVCFGKSNTCAGYLWSYNKVEQLPAARISKDKKVYKYDLEGNYIQEYENSQMAAVEYQVKRGTINSACSGKIDICAGYQWRYEKYKNISPISAKAKKVYKYDLNGNYIQEYNSIKIPANEYHVTRSAIQKACNGDTKTCAGYQWSYEKSETIKEPRTEQREIKKVYQYDTNGYFLKEYENLSVAAKDMNVSTTAIRYACMGKTKTCAGYKWSYSKMKRYDNCLFSMDLL